VRCNGYMVDRSFFGASKNSKRTSPIAAGVDLGPYEEPLRRFLLGEIAFPDQFALSIRVSTLPELYQTAHAPASENGDGFHFYRFAIPGLVFILFVGSRIPKEYFAASTVPAPERYISIHPKSEMADLNEAIELRQSASSHRK
jgi:hypothetical protein